MIASTHAADTPGADLNPPVVAVRGLTKEYGRVPALSGLDLEVPRGAVHCLAGRVGTGKTTALSIIAGLAHPTRGTVRVFGIDPARDASCIRHQVALLRQQPRFYGWMSARETLQFSGRFLRLSAARLEQCQNELLELAGLLAARDATVDEYSTGMRQRLGIVRALVGGPQLLLLDQPDAGLDGGERARIAGMIQRVRGPVTVIFTADDSCELQQIADGVTVVSGSGEQRRVA